jgi:MFS family permease
VLIGGFVLLLARIPYSHERPAESALTLSSLSAGFRFIWNTKVVLSVMMLDMFGVLLGGATALMPIYAKDILHVGANGLGWLLAAPSTGAFVSALTQAHRGPLRHAGRTILLAVACFGAATIVFGISRSFPLSLAMLFVLGVCDNISVVVRSTLVQMSTPDDMRGRVSALNGLFIGTSNELGAFESGAVANLVGPTASVVIGGFGTIVVALITAWLSPALRKYGWLGGPPG